jgi:hypothetical protein
MNGPACATTNARIVARATPFKSEDLTELVEQDNGEFIALRSPDSAEHDPGYREVGRFPTREKAEEFLASVELD